MFNSDDMSLMPGNWYQAEHTIHDISPSTMALSSPLWRPAAMDFDSETGFNGNHEGVDTLLDQSSSLENSFGRVSVHSSNNSNDHISSNEVSSSYLLETSDYGGRADLTNVSTVSTSGSGSLAYTSLCLEGIPSSTVAEFQPESAPTQSDGIYTMLAPQKDKEVDVVEEAEFSPQSKKVLCDLCGKWFESDALLNKHKHSHNGSHLHVCPVCEKGFAWQIKLEQHMITHTGNGNTLEEPMIMHTDNHNKPFMCEVCGKHFRNHGYLKTHTKMHKLGRMYKCSLCGRELISLNHLRKHLELKHTRDGIYEGESGARYTSNEYLNETMRIDADQQYQKRTCEYCDLELPDESAYIIHKKLHLANGEIKCRYCEKIVYNYSYLKMHEKSHSMVKNHKCDLCGKAFYHFKRLKTHMQTCASIGKSKTDGKLEIKPPLKLIENDTCLVCEITFPSKEDLQEHTERHTVDEKTYRCILCHTSFEGVDSLSRLRHHMMKYHHVDKPHKCKECEKSFFFEARLINHMKVHSRAKPYSCDKCDESFVRENQLKLHRAKHTSKKPLQCPEREKRFYSSSALTQQQMVHDENAFFCKLCFRQLCSKNSMESHMVQMHSGENLVYCDVCNVPFSRKSYLVTHMQENHKGYVQKGTTKCPKCPRHFTKKSSLKVHMRAHASEMPFRCDICGRGFTLETGMIVHRKTHFNAVGELLSTPMKCCICGKFFKRPADCRNHQATHSKIQIYKCDLCEKGFAYPHNLKRHKESHIVVKTDRKGGRKPKEDTDKGKTKGFKCDLCKAKFLVEELLDDHRNMHFDALFKFECSICGDGFRRKGELNLHYKYHEERDMDDMVDNGNNGMIYECDICRERFRTLVELQIHDEIHCFSPGQSDSSESEEEEEEEVVEMEEEVEEEKKEDKEKEDIEEKRIYLRKKPGRPRGRPKLAVNRERLNRKVVTKTYKYKNSVKQTPAIPYISKIITKQSRRKRVQLGLRSTIKKKVRFDCSECSMQFSSIPALKRHIRAHKEIYSCLWCKETFWILDDLEDHMETHTGTLVLCEFCPATFTHYINHQNHMAAEHPALVKRKGRPKKNPFSCTDCRMSFRLMEHVDAHKTMHTATVRIRRGWFESDTVRISDSLLDSVNYEVKHTVKQEVDDFDGELREATLKQDNWITESDLFDKSTTSFVNFEKLDNSVNTPCNEPIQEFNSTSFPTDHQNNLPATADTPSPKSPEQFYTPDLGDDLSLENSTDFDLLKPADASSIENTRNSTFIDAATTNLKIHESVPEVKELKQTKAEKVENHKVVSKACESNTHHISNITKACNTTRQLRSRSKGDVCVSKYMSKSVKNFDHQTPTKSCANVLADKDKCFRCCICDEYFAKSSSLEDHLTVHTDSSRPTWRFHLELGPVATYACVHINNISKTCSKSFDEL